MATQRQGELQIISWVYQTIRNHQSQAEIKCCYFRVNRWTGVETWQGEDTALDPERIVRCSESHRDGIGLLGATANSRVSGGSEAPAVLPTLFLFFFCPSWRTLDVFPRRPPARGLAGAEMSRAASRNESQALVIMLWIINAEYQSAETLAAAAQLSDSGPSRSCIQILNIYSPAQLTVCSGKPPNTLLTEQL